MLDFLDRLRAKPQHTRLTIALVSSGVVTAGIAAIWAVSFLQVIGAKTPAVDQGSSTLGSFSQLKDRFQEGLTKAERAAAVLPNPDPLFDQGSTTESVATSTTDAVVVETDTKAHSTSTATTSTTSATTVPEAQSVSTTKNQSTPQYDESGVEVVEI